MGNRASELTRDELILKMQKHSFSRYDLDGKYIPHPYANDNLLEYISQRETYVVDNNSTWKSQCKAHPDKAFVIHAALAREDWNTISLVLNEERNKIGNVFGVGFYPNGGFVLVDKLDEHFEYTFDIDKLKVSSQINGRGLDDKMMCVQSNETQKDNIRKIISYALKFADVPRTDFPAHLKASELPMSIGLQGGVVAIEVEIFRQLARCKYNFNLADYVSALAYSKLLLLDRPTRNDFDRPDYDNVFGDMKTLAIAIYLQAKLLTSDVGLKKMATYAGIDSLSNVPVIQNPP